ncbi:MAG: Gfo/Idh/MocA family oxidoreductase [Ferruginibacter sp.]
MQPIKTALCSFGMSGWVFHAPFLQAHPGFELYAVWERTKNLAQEKYPSIKTFRDFDGMLADDAIELVVINTPSITHYDYTKKALLAGKHVIVEKPFTATVAEADELIALAQQQQKMLTVFQNRRNDSDYLTVKKIIRSGLLGEIKEAEIHYDRFTPELSYKAHKEAATPAVGIVYDLGAHLLDAALQLFGLPNAVFADMMIMRENSLVDDYFEILLYYPSCRVRVKATMFAKEPQGFIIHGSRGSFIKSRGDVQEAQLQQHKNPLDADYGIEPEPEWGLLHYEKDGHFIKEKIKSEPGNYRRYYDGVYEAIVHRKPPPVTAGEARNVIKVIEAAYSSFRSKKIVFFS